MVDEGSMDLEGVSDFQDLSILAESRIFEGFTRSRVTDKIKIFKKFSKTARDCTRIVSLASRLMSGDIENEWGMFAGQVLHTNGVETLEMVLDILNRCKPADKVCFTC